MSSTLNPDEEPLHTPDEGEPRGHDTGSLGPGDSSDSGSDVAGAKRHDFDRDTELDEHALETGDTEGLLACFQSGYDAHAVHHAKASK